MMNITQDIRVESFLVRNVFGGRAEPMPEALSNSSGMAHGHLTC